MIFGGALQKAIDADDPAAIAAAVEGGEAVSSTALGHAVSSDKHAALGALLERVDSVPATPLILAAQNGRNEALATLLTKADPDTADASGLTALFYAALSNHVDCVDTLVGAGASVAHQDGQGRQALDIAIKHGSRDAAEALVRHGAPVSDAQGPLLAKLGVAVDAAPAPADDTSEAFIGRWLLREVRYEGDFEEAGWDPEGPDTMSAEDLGIAGNDLVISADGKASGTYFGVPFEGSWTADGDTLTVVTGDSPVAYRLYEGPELQRSDQDEEHGLDMFVSYGPASD